jgi:hypothetical protein
LLWSGDPTGGEEAVGAMEPTDAADDVLAVLTQTAPPPQLAVGNVDAEGELLGAEAVTVSGALTQGLLEAVVTGLSRQVADALADSFAPGTGSDRRGEGPTAYAAPRTGITRWVGGLAQLPGAWLPELAVLPRSRRDLDDPGTRWETESLAFAMRHTVHATDQRYAADLLAPHVTALVLDHVPDDAAVTIAGDALHVWWEYSDRSRMGEGRARRTAEVAARLRDALPSFVLADHPDHSHRVEERMAERAARAAAYRAQRRAGRHQDPTMQRIYAQAQAEYQASRVRD